MRIDTIHTAHLTLWPVSSAVPSEAKLGAFEVGPVTSGLSFEQTVLIEAASSKRRQIETGEGENVITD